ncbi:DinB family protein [Roseobacter sp. HKCCA0434]|uniref:DinB family protein n=1 Tax=Roseobacter sp. HKCCA0434 TaxID=3079297 RepID=UPI002905CED6|nr:DinB family protein [Roseobacter sp. HKCCA0434]
MITSDWVRMMARYSAWQNGAQVAAAGTLDEGARREDRRAFFASIHGTMNHLLWADRIWMSRLAGMDGPSAGSITMSTEEEPDWDSLTAARGKLDAEILRWSQSLNDADLRGDMSWYSGAAGKEIGKPTTTVLTHMFNHQTHHRGQIHAMLTAAGAAPGDTDLFLMPDDV